MNNSIKNLSEKIKNNEYSDEKTREEANDLIEKHSKFWMSIPGTRGAIGKKTVNSSTYFGALFDVVEPEVEELEDGEFTEDQEHLLEELEDEQL